MLLKSLASLLVAMMVCLIGGNWLVKFLTWPLTQAERFRGFQDRSVPLHIGTNRIASLAREDLVDAFGTNLPRSIRLAPVAVGSNLVLAVVADTEPWTAPARGITVLKNYTPLGGVMTALKLGLYGGCVLGAPFILFFIGQFVLPALHFHEKKLLYQIVGFGSVLFFMGVAFCYFLMTGVALSAAVQFSEWLGFGADEWRAEDYIGFMCKFMLATGLAFELPVVILTIVKLGFLDYKQLNRFRSYWIVIALVVAAVLTPSADPFTMILMAFPLWILYEISTGIAWYWHRRDRKLAAEADAADQG